jgi:ribosome assembly protein YihI (activator of Der GTPase)
MSANEIKTRIAAYRAAREAFDNAESDECLDEALDALAAADALVREIETFFGNADK